MLQEVEELGPILEGLQAREETRTDGDRVTVVLAEALL